MQPSLFSGEEALEPAAPRLTEWAPDQWPVADDWRPLVDAFVASPAGQQLGQFIRERLAQGAVIYPPEPFKALALTPLRQVKVVILGQDPYHGPRQAQGLAFSVAPGVRLPPSLRNIFKEIAQDPQLGAAAEVPRNGSLESWARQGVLLLNTCLTVEAGLPGSHARRGWEALTDQLIGQIAGQPGPLVFMLWGAHAQAKQAFIDASAFRSSHLVLAANHPSPLSALRGPQPFMGCGHFSLANNFLEGQGLSPIQWSLR
jgi:uracil-DNA glycosylase